MILLGCLFCEKMGNYYCDIFDTYKCEPCRATYYLDDDCIYVTEFEVLMGEGKQDFLIYDNVYQNIKLLSRNMDDFSRSTIINEKHNITLDDLPSEINLAKGYFRCKNFV